MAGRGKNPLREFISEDFKNDELKRLAKMEEKERKLEQDLEDANTNVTHFVEIMAADNKYTIENFEDLNRVEVLLRRVEGWSGRIHLKVKKPRDYDRIKNALETPPMASRCTNFQTNDDQFEGGELPVRILKLIGTFSIND